MADPCGEAGVTEGELAPESAGYSMPEHYTQRHGSWVRRLARLGCLDESHNDCLFEAMVQSAPTDLWRQPYAEVGA